MEYIMFWLLTLVSITEHGVTTNLNYPSELYDTKSRCEFMVSGLEEGFARIEIADGTTATAKFECTAVKYLTAKGR